jgi:PAP2 superfamily
MNGRKTALLLLALSLTFAALVAAATPGPGAAHSTPPVENAVSKWSLISQNAVSAGKAPAASEILHGLVHAAMYDAVNSITEDDEPFAVSIRPRGSSSVDAAVAAAARGVLVVRVPAQAAAVEAAYTSFLAGIEDGARKTNGIRIGKAVAGAYLALRADDGYDDVVLFQQQPVGPGVFEPIALTSPVDPKLAKVRPLSFESPSRFRPGGPDPLTSASYAEDFNEVKKYGRADSAFRTAAETEIVRFHTEQTMIQFNRLVRALALEHRLDLGETARMMAMVHVATADSMIGCWEAKYWFNYWRPVHAIQRAGTDGNPDTEADPTWTHLVTGNHPEYPSGHSCFTAGVTYSLAEYFGNDLEIDTNSTVTGTTRHYDRLRDLRAEVGLARIYGGLHFRKAIDDGDQIGRRTSRYVLRDNFRERDD